MSTKTYAVVAIVLISLTLRIWGINHEIYTDENKVIAPSVKLAQGKQEPLLYPKGSYYPHLYHYILGLAFVPAALQGAPYPSPDSSVDTYSSIARIITALLGVGTVLITYIIGTRLQGPITGMLAAALIAIMPLHIKYSHYAHVDIPLTLLTSLVILTCINIWKSPSTKWYVLAGICTGLSGATHYTGFVVGIALLLAHIHTALQTKPLQVRTLISKPFLLALILIPISFFIASPYTIIKSREALDIYKQLSLRGAAGDLGYTRPTFIWPLYTTSPDWGLPFTTSGLIWEFNPLITVLAGIGLAISFMKRKWLPVILLGGTLVIMYTAIIGRLPLYAIKRLLPLTPLIALFSAIAINEIGQFKKSIWSASLAIILLASIVLPSTYQAIGFNMAYARASTHSQAVAFALQNIPHGSTVLQHTPIKLIEWNDPNYKTVRLNEVYANFNAADPEVSHDRAKPLGYWTQEQHVQFVVMDSRIVDRYFDPTSIKLFPQTTASYQHFYTDIRSRGKLVYRIEPALWQAAGPRVEIYDVTGLQ